MHPMPALIALFLLVALSACDRGQPPNPVPAQPVGATKSPRWTAVEELVRKKDLPGAYAALEVLRVEGRPDAELTLRLAEVRRLQSEPVKAILLLREGLAAEPQAHQLVVPLASLYLQVGDNKLAREVLEGGRAAGASSYELNLLLGQTYGRLELNDLALREFEGAEALGAKPHIVLYNRALVLGQMKKHDEAIRALEEVVRVDPEWPAGRRELARAILDSLPKERAPVERALDMLVGVQEKLAEDWRLHESIGDAWLLLGDYDAALQAYTEALRFGKNPKSVEDRYRVAATKKKERETSAVPPPAK